MVVKRQWSDLSSFAHDQLDARNSEFADAPDFRVYKFAKGKWPEFALRTVVSAHREEATYRQDFPEMRPLPSGPVDRGNLGGSSASAGAQLEGGDPWPQLEDHSNVEEPDERQSRAEQMRKTEPDIRDEEPDYGPQEDHDLNEYSSTLWPEREERRRGDDDLNEEGPARKPNGGPGHKTDT